MGSFDFDYCPVKHLFGRAPPEVAFNVKDGLIEFHPLMGG
jgi:hypothetical protein